VASEIRPTLADQESSLDRDILRQDKQGHQPTVLVVDDDLGLQDLFRTFFEGLFERIRPLLAG